MTSQVLGTALGIIGLAALVFTALRFRREDTGQLVEQSTKLVSGMETITKELRAERDNAKTERDEAKRERDEARAESVALRAEVAAGRAEVEAARAEVAASRAEVSALRAEILKLHTLFDTGKPGGDV